MRSAAWLVWTGPAGGWHDWRVLEGLSRRAQDMYAVLLAASEPMPTVVPLPRREQGLPIELRTYWGRRVQMSMAELTRLAGAEGTSGWAARRELEDAGLVAVLQQGGGQVGCANVYAVACGPGAAR